MSDKSPTNTTSRTRRGRLRLAGLVVVALVAAAALVLAFGGDGDDDGDVDVPPADVVKVETDDREEPDYDEPLEGVERITDCDDLEGRRAAAESYGFTDAVRAYDEQAVDLNCP